MKKALILFILLIVTNITYSQNYFNTTTSSSNSSLDLSHLGTFTLGSTFESINDPWRSGEGRVIEGYIPTGNISMRLGNNYGKFSIAIAGADGAFFPIAKRGDIVIRSQTTKRVYFSLNNTNNDGTSAFVFGDNLNHKTLSIFNNGRIGIGITNPQETLHINGSVRGNIGSGALRIKSESGYIDIGAVNGSWAHIKTDRPKFWFNKDIYSGTNVFSSYSGDLILQTAGNEKFRIKKSNGYVGIGTTNPQEKFQIANSYTFHDGGHKVISFMYQPTGNVDLDNSKYSAEIRFDPVNGNLILGTSSSITNAPTSHLTINKQGNMGIGTSSPDEKLTVKGKIHTQEIIVDLQGAVAPDYVFEKDYDLKSLEEIEIYIKENKHLPEIPSSKKMEEEGVYLKKMNLLLLKKIEELTLYMIEQEKRIKALEKN